MTVKLHYHNTIKLQTKQEDRLLELTQALLYAISTLRKEGKKSPQVFVVDLESYKDERLRRLALDHVLNFVMFCDEIEVIPNKIAALIWKGRVH